MTRTTTGSTAGSGCGSSRQGCGGCLGSLFVICFASSILFGGGVLFRFGQWGGFAVGNPVDTNQVIAAYLDELGSKAKIADEAVKRFHKQLNQGNCQETYLDATEHLRSKTDQSGFVDLCSEIKSKFGSVVATAQVDWWGGPDEQGGRYVLTRHYTTFSRTPAQETFIWLVKDRKTQLVSYQIAPGQGLSTQNPASSRPATSL